MRNVLIVLSGPSGVGKGTIAKLLTASDEISLSISCTTREPRERERNGREYFFITKEEFNEKVEKDGFLEYSTHFENSYGTPKDFVFDKLKTKDVLLEIDVNGGLEVKKNYPQALLIFVTPPSEEEIRKRLKGRNTETEEKIKLRMERIGYEMSKKDLYDYNVCNDDLDLTVEKIREIIKKEKSK